MRLRSWGAAVLLLAALVLLAACHAAPAPASSAPPPIAPTEASQPEGPSHPHDRSTLPADASHQEVPQREEPSPQPPQSSPEPAPQQEIVPQQEAEPVLQPTPPVPANHTLYILMYHHIVEDGQSCNNWTITTSRLREDLQWLQDQGYTYVLPSQLAAGEPLPEKAVLLTFDDGYASNYTLGFPILQEFQAKAVISLVTSFLQEGQPDFLTWDMCRELADSGLVEFGCHSHDLHHESPRGLKRISGESREDYEARIFPDLQTSIDLIQANLDTPVLFFAYPYGQRERWANDFLQDRFAITVTTRHGPANLSNGLYQLPRHNITVNHPVREFLP